MKSMIRLTLIGIVCVSVFACKSKKSSTATVSGTNNTTTTSTPPATQPITPVATPVASPKEGATTRFVVSFFSIGEGIDNKTNDEFVQFLKSYPKKVGFEPKMHGREGETEYCLALTELAPAEQTEFIKKANAILGKSKLVRVKENAPCEFGMAAPVQTAPSTDDNYRLVVSFYSAGEGVDNKTKGEFESFLNNYTKKTTFTPTPWGREGETDYCLKLSELSPAEQADFVKKSKELLSKSKLVHVDENAKCVHKH